MVPYVNSTNPLKIPKSKDHKTKYGKLQIRNKSDRYVPFTSCTWTVLF